MKNRCVVSMPFGVAVIAALMTAGTAAAQERPAPATTTPAQRESSARTGGDDIKVHGHWTIDVRNPDGTLASHNEFENACALCADMLAALLTKQQTMGSWLIQLGDDNGSGPCMFSGQTQ